MPVRVMRPTLMQRGSLSEWREMTESRMAQSSAEEVKTMAEESRGLTEAD